MREAPTLVGGFPDVPRRRSRRPRPLRRVRLEVGVAGAVLALDQATKVAAVAVWSGAQPVDWGPVHLHVIRNPGGPFGFAPGSTVWFALLALIAIPLLFNAASVESSLLGRAAIGLALGGAGANLVDRIARAPSPLRGAVVDWLRIDPYRPVFNVADVALRAGATLMLVALIAARKSERGGARDPVAT